MLNNEQKEFIIKNYTNTTNRDLCKQLNIEYEELRTFVGNYNGINYNNKLLKNLEIRKDYNTKYILSKDYSYIYNSMNKIIEPKVENLFKSKYGKYFINQDYFEKIDNEFKAYWLGFCYADGCNQIKFSNKKNKWSFIFSFSLKREDKEHLQKFLNSIQSDTIIKDRIMKAFNKEFEISDLDICNRKFCEDLNKLGCVPNKTYILKFPTEEIVPKEFMRDFIRGFFDGDGCVHITLNKKYPHKKSNSYIINFTGMEEFLTDLKKYLEANVENIHGRINGKKGTVVKSLFYNDSKSVENLFVYLYKDSNICLERKMNIFKKLFN